MGERAIGSRRGDEESGGRGDIAVWKYGEWGFLSVRPLSFLIRPLEFGIWNLESGIDPGHEARTLDMNSENRLKNFRTRIENAQGFLFDLDNTLYTSEKGVFDRINERINRFVIRLTGKSLVEVQDLRGNYIDRYGTTLRGLMTHNNVEPEQFLDDVHDISLDGLLERDPGLRDMLSGILLPKVVFTNATAIHAARVLDALGIAGCFDDICDLESTGYFGKPHPESYRTAAGMAGSEVDRTVLVDDLEVNVRGAIQCGMSAIRVGGPESGPDELAVDRVQDLAQAFQGLPWFRPV